MPDGPSDGPASDASRGDTCGKVASRGSTYRTKESQLCHSRSVESERRRTTGLRFRRSTNPSMVATSMLATHLIRARIAILIVLFSSAAFAQVPGIAVSLGTQISADNAKSPHAESFPAINPKNSNNWIATSIVVESGHSHTSVYATLDGGRTWERAR
jgi:hypothetical protein